MKRAYLRTAAIALPVIAAAALILTRRTPKLAAPSVDDARWTNIRGKVMSKAFCTDHCGGPGSVEACRACATARGNAAQAPSPDQDDRWSEDAVDRRARERLARRRFNDQVHERICELEAAEEPGLAELAIDRHQKTAKILDSVHDLRDMVAGLAEVPRNVCDLTLQVVELLLAHESSPVPSGSGACDTGSARVLTVQETADIHSPGVGAASGVTEMPSSPEATNGALAKPTITGARRSGRAV